MTQTIIDLFEKRGNERYGKEDVTQLQHALQCAALAQAEEAGAVLVTAALLHDIGHLMGEEHMPATTTENLDDGHEEKAHEWLNTLFGPEVADPVRLHVAAKRYLCTVDPSYSQKLSPTSYKSYLDQGGPMSDAERRAFEAEPHYQAALRLRHWDDQAKAPDLQTPEITAFVPYLEEVLGS